LKHPKHSENIKNIWKNMGKHTLQKGLMFMLLGGVLIASVAPVSAQGGPQPTPAPFVTPTPLPGVQASYSAAQQAQNAAQASIAQAAKLDGLASEMRRNAEAQQAQAAQAYSDARAASAAQNGAAIGEAIGRGEAALSQLRDSVSGQAVIISTLTAQTQAQAQEVYSLTTELQAARTDKQTILDSYTAIKSQGDKVAAQAETDSTLGYIVKGFLFVVVTVLLIRLIIFVLQRRGERVTIIDHTDAMDSAAPDEPQGGSDETPRDSNGTL
jgi:chaperonin cofactor prefoldin